MYTQRYSRGDSPASSNTRKPSGSRGGSNRPQSRGASRPSSGGFKRPGRDERSRGAARRGSSSYGGGSRGGYGGRGGSRGGSRGGGVRGGEFRDISKFVNKAKPQEVVVYQAKHTFADFAIDEQLKGNVLYAKYTAPTPIQDEAIPHILAGRDIVGIANTGTGKTAAFLIPLLDKVMKDRNQKVIIMAPTRELAIQINQELLKFAFRLNIYSVCVVGGAPLYKQTSELRRSHNFVIGTPGRIKDHIERGNIRLEQFRNVVLDEADRMLDMGFIEDMRFLLAKMPKPRHTLFFSATLSREIEKLISEFLVEPVSISVKTRDTAESIDQDVVHVTSANKYDVLHDILTQPECQKVLVFGRTKSGVERLAQFLHDRGIRVEAIHGDRSHSQRQRALRALKEDKVNVLVATDVAARGLDIPNVSHVINFELPSTYEDYVHRIGRTGRGGKTGKALTFIQ